MKGRARVRAGLAWAALAGLAGAQLGGTTGDPFAAGVRWSHAPDPGEAWLPRSVALALDGELVFVGASGSDPRQLVLGGHVEWDGTGNQPLLVDEASAHAGAAPLRVDAGGGLLFALAEPAAGTRRLTAHPATGPDTLAWSFDPLPLGAGSARLAASDDGARLALAELDAPGARVRLTVLDGTTGAWLFERSIPGTSLRHLALSSDGMRSLLQIGGSLVVHDGSGTELHREDLPFVPSAVAFSPDGGAVAHGTFGTVGLLREGPGGYASAPPVPGPAGFTPTALALSEAGGRLLAGWWRVADGRAVELVAYDVDGPAILEHPLAVQESPGAPYQNYVEACALDGGGDRAAFGLWGTGDDQPEVLLFDVPSGAVRVAADLSGSVFALDLDPRGERLVVGAKAVHANQFGSQGSVVSFAAGTADLSLSRTLLAGTSSSVHARATGASAALCLVGRPAPAVSVPGLVGLLQLDAGAPVVVLPMLPDGPDRFRLPLLPQVGWQGLDLALQGLTLSPGGLALTATPLVPPVL